MRFFKYTADKGERVECVHFDTMADVTNATVPSHNRKRWQRTLENTGITWLGMSGGHPAVEKAAADGWQDGLRVMESYGERLLKDEDITVSAAAATRKKRKRRRGDSGMSIDMDRVYNGQLDTAWTRMQHVEKIQQSPRNVVVYINMATPAVVTAEESLWRGALSFAVSNYLIQSGYSVKIVVGSTGREVCQGDRRNDIKQTSCTLKDYNTQISPAHLALACSVGFHRHFNFKMKMLFNQRVNHTLGYSVGRPDLLPEDCQKDVKAGVRVVYIDNNITSFSAAKRELKEVLKRLADDRTDNRVGR